MSIPCTKNIMEELKMDKQYYVFIDNVFSFMLVLIAWLIYRYPFFYMKLSRGVWVELVRILPLELIGEGESNLLQNNKDTIKNALLDKKLNIDMNELDVTRYLKLIDD
jgi:hypothetical protein